MKKITAMQTNNQFRSGIALLAFAFAALATACTQSDGNEAIPPVDPSISIRPARIITLENGIEIRRQDYQYKPDGKLRMYISHAEQDIDTVILQSNGMEIRRKRGSDLVREFLFLNADKAYANFRTTESGVSFDFENSGNHLSRIFKSGPNAFQTLIAQTTYENGSLAGILSEDTEIRITYYNELPYQKGVNELPTEFSAFTYYKIAESEMLTSTLFYNKLIREYSIIENGILEDKHEYAYTFDNLGRVMEIDQVIRRFDGPATTTRTLKHRITY
jgi:hypothetical protein